MDAESSDNAFQFAKDNELSRLVHEQPAADLQESLREELAELGMPVSVSEQQFAKRFARVQQMIGSNQQENAQQYRQLWNLSTGIRPSMRMASMRMSIAMEYCRLLSEQNQLEQLCMWLALALHPLQREQQLFSAKGANLQVLYFLLAKSQIQVERLLPQANATLSKIEQLMKGANEATRKTLTLKLLFLRSKYAEALGNKEEQYQQLQKAIDYIKHNRIESNFASKLDLLFHKLQAKRTREQPRHERASFSAHRQQTKSRDLPIDRSIHHVRKKPTKQVQVRPSTATRSRSTLKSLHKQQQCPPIQRSAKQSFHRKSVLAQSFEFPTISNIEPREMTLADFMLPRPQYSKAATPTNKATHQLTVLTPELPQEVINQAAPNELLGSVSAIGEPQEEEASNVLEVSYALSPKHQLKHPTEGEVVDGSQPDHEEQSLRELEFQGLNSLLEHEPRRSLLDEFIDMDSPYNMHFQRAVFYCNSIVLRLLTARILLKESMEAAGLIVHLQLVLQERQQPIVVDYHWKAERFLNCKARLLEFINQVGGTTEEVTCTRDMYDEQIKAAVYRVAVKYLSPVITMGKYRLNMDLLHSASKGSRNNEFSITDGKQYYRNTSTLEKVKKTTSRFIAEDSIQTFSTLQPNSFRSSMRQHELFGETQRQTMIRNLSPGDQCGTLQSNFGHLLSTVQNSHFWNSMSHGSKRPSKSKFSMLGRLDRISRADSRQSGSDCQEPPSADQVPQPNPLFGVMVRTWFAAASENEQANCCLQLYFDSLQIKCQCPIRNRGQCMVKVTAYRSKRIFGCDRQYFRLEVTPNNSITNIMKIVVSCDDLQLIIGQPTPQIREINELHALVTRLWPLLSYEKEKVYAGLTLDLANRSSNYSYRNKLANGSGQQQSESTSSFLSRKLKKVQFLVQRVVKISLNNKTSHLILSIRKFAGHPAFVVCLYSPQTTRNMSFEVSGSLLERLADHQIAYLLGIPSVIGKAQKQRLLSDFLHDREQVDRIKRWSRLCSLITFETIQFVDKKCLCALLANQPIFSMECFWTELTEVAGLLTKAEIRMFGKELSRQSFCTELLSNLTIRELQQFVVLLQLKFVQSNQQLCLRFSLEDFICVVLSVPNRTKVHPHLGCTTINLADLTFMYDAVCKKVYECLEEALLKHSVEALCTSANILRELHTTIQNRIQMECKALDFDKGEKVSMNCYKRQEKQDYLDVMFKGILRYRKRTILGVFYDSTSKDLVVRTEDKQVRTKRLSLSKASLPFVPDSLQVDLLRRCDKRLYKGLRNRLLMWTACG